MKKLIVITCTMMIMFGLAGIALADSDIFVSTYTIIKQNSGPFVSISTLSNKLEFGRPTFAEPVLAPGLAMFPSIYRSAAASLTIHVESNCLHGPIVASVTALKHSGGYTIPPERILIHAPIMEEDEFVRMARPVVISKPENGPHDIELIFKLQATHFDYAGRYSGAITFTIMPRAR